MIEGNFANPVEVVLAGLQALLPAEQQPVDAWAAENRYLANAGGGYVGRWDPKMLPYLNEPMRTLTSRLHNATILAGPGQCGKTAIGENWLGQSIATDPASFLWYMQTDDAVAAYVKEVINPFIDNHEVLLARKGLRPVDDSLGFKRFRAMTAQFLAANYNNLISKKAPRIVVDEVDAMDPSMGDVKTLTDVRSITFGSGAHQYFCSHPDLATGMRPDRDWTRGIMSYYAISDRRLWWWGCPHCNGYSSPNPMADRYMAIHYEEAAPLDEIADMARLLCPCCGTLIEDGARYGMNQVAHWVGEGQTIDVDGTITGDLKPNPIAGFWVVGAMSTIARGGIGKLAADRVRAERRFAMTNMDADESTLRQVVVKQWGFIYERPKGEVAIDVEALIERAAVSTSAWRVVPDWVRFIMIGVDVQKGRFEVKARGYGVGGESAIIDRFMVFQAPEPDEPGGMRPVDPSRRQSDWDLLIEPVFNRIYPLQDDPTRGMRPRCVTIDSQGEPGVTDRAYKAWLSWRDQRIVKRHGVSREKYDLFTILLTRGLSGRQAKRLSITYPGSQRKDRKASAGGNVPVASFNPNLFKDTAAGQLRTTEPGPDYVHIPRQFVEFDEKTRRPAETQPIMDQFGAEERDKTGAWKKTGTARNEMLDLMGLTQIGAEIWGLRGINWERPPSWAEIHDKNALVVPIEHSEALETIDAGEEAAFVPHDEESGRGKADFAQLARERARRLNRGG